jgi:hypothetical protein
MAYGLLGAVFLGCYIAPFVIGSMMATKQIDREGIPWAAGLLITAILASIALSTQSFVVELFGTTLANWSWLPPLVGFPLGFAFGRIADSSLK